jgi:hypothetical protein
MDCTERAILTDRTLEETSTRHYGYDAKVILCDVSRIALLSHIPYQWANENRSVARIRGEA